MILWRFRLKTPISAGVPANWPHNFSGFAAHWNKNANFGNAFDQWFLNLFPRVRPFVANEGGYLTLSFIPTLGTMILGLVAGRWYRTFAPIIPLKRFVVAGVIGIAAGLLLHFTGICPVVKRIWTPSWTLFSGGICCACGRIHVRCASEIGTPEVSQTFFSKSRRTLFDAQIFLEWF